MTFRPVAPPGQHIEMPQPTNPATAQPLADAWRPLERELRRQQRGQRRRGRLRDVLSRLARLAVRLQ